VGDGRNGRLDLSVAVRLSLRAMAIRREPVSIVTVFNDPEVRRDCLDRSLEAHREDAPCTEYLPVDNAAGAFASAGAALNHGAAQASHDYVAFVHQDVYLHSLVALEEAAGRLADDDGIGLLGAVGVTSEGRFVGRVRDRIYLLGASAREPTIVDTVDELLFIIPRHLLESEPLTEDPELAWHAYAVEYGLRVQAQGKRVCVVDIPVTHNSLTVNVDRLELAYAAVPAKYPAGMPIFTPQGKVPRVRERSGALSAHRWRYRWLLESVGAHRARRALGGGRWVLADIRLDVDDLLAAVSGGTPLLVISVDEHGGFVDERPGPLALTRAGRPMQLTSRPRAELAAAVEAAVDRPVLVTNLTLEDLRGLAGQLAGRQPVMGLWSSLGYWALLGVPRSAVPASWQQRRATPLGMSAP
jgi:hypothetical protein